MEIILNSIAKYGWGVFFTGIGLYIIWAVIQDIIFNTVLLKRREAIAEKNFLNKKLEVFKKNIDDKLLKDIENNDLTKIQTQKKWFASMVAEAYSLEADVVANFLRLKKRPAKKRALEIEGPLKLKMQKLVKENKLLKIENSIFDEYFPEYTDLREHILESEKVLMEVSDENDQIDMARKYLTPKEYKELDQVSRNQLALDKYKNRNHSNLEIGRFYERYVGYLYEKEKWSVRFQGIVDGFEDLGRDLICKKGNKIKIIQAKNWSKKKTIHEKHIYQLYATKVHYCLERNLTLINQKNVEAVFVTTTELSIMAKKVASFLKITVKTIPLKKDYPMIKCNINPDKKTKIYHLPFDQQYDKILIGDQKGEKYVSTIKEAEKSGYRRAFRWRGNN
tara:strand:- start:134 stop:1309 length:1176 start_codon:yes stop_codon:yes gene_type:complete